MTTITLYRAINLLSSPGGATIGSLQNRLNISRRTAYRILDRMQEMGFPLYDEGREGRRKLWKLDENYVTRLPNINLPDLQLNRQEILLLDILLTSGNTLGNSEWDRVRKSLIGKLGYITPDSGNAVITPLKTGMKSYRGKEEFLSGLLEAVSHRRICNGDYTSFGHRRTLNLTLRPLGLFDWNRGIYVFCLLEPSLASRMLAVERFTMLEIREEIFSDSEISPETLLEKAFTVTWDDPIRAVIRFDASSAPYVKARQWAPDQIFTDYPDGSTVLTMETSGFHDVLHWVLGFGAAAEVLEPESLVMGVRGQLEKMTARYELPD